MTATIKGIIPVMLTPFTEADAIDYAGLENLVEWYIANGADALFAVAQSSEMQFLSLEERVALARFVVRQAAGRVPVIASGHVSESRDDQVSELTAIAATGVDGLVLVTNRFDPKGQGGAVFMDHLRHLLDALPADLPLGLYECPAPFRRLMSDDELAFCAESERFAILKDVSCDLETVKRRVALTKNSSLAIVNANAAIAFDAIRSGIRRLHRRVHELPSRPLQMAVDRQRAASGAGGRSLRLSRARGDGRADGISQAGQAVPSEARHVRLRPQPDHRFRHP